MDPREFIDRRNTLEVGDMIKITSMNYGPYLLYNHTYILVKKIRCDPLHKADKCYECNGFLLRFVDKERKNQTTHYGICFTPTFLGVHPNFSFKKEATLRVELDLDMFKV